MTISACAEGPERTADWGEAPVPTPAPSVSATTPAQKSITMNAVGDIIMGNAAGSRDPVRQPANGGRTFFDKVTHLFNADFVMGNMEQPITDDTGHVRCSTASPNCHQYRVSPEYATYLKKAGFDLMNLANNHGHDYGPRGYTNTRKALTDAGVAYTGPRDYVAVVEVKGLKVAVVGFSSYPRDNSLIDLNQAKQIVKKATTLADIVVVQVHMGAEGSDRGHVRPGTEMFLGENRGDPIKFAHTVVDAGADMLIGHGPHTLRGMELYKGRLIAYSLGNFGGGGILKGERITGWGGVLKITLNADGSFVSGQFASTVFVTQPGIPAPDPAHQGLDLLRKLTGEDFPKTGPLISATGAISPRP